MHLTEIPGHLIKRLTSLALLVLSASSMSSPTILSVSRPLLTCRPHSSAISVRGRLMLLICSRSEDDDTRVGHDTETLVHVAVLSCRATPHIPRLFASMDYKLETPSPVHTRTTAKTHILYRIATCIMYTSQFIDVLSHSSSCCVPLSTVKWEKTTYGRASGAISEAPSM